MWPRDIRAKGQPVLVAAHHVVQCGKALPILEPGMTHQQPTMIGAGKATLVLAGAVQRGPVRGGYGLAGHGERPAITLSPRSARWKTAPGIAGGTCPRPKPPGDGSCPVKWPGPCRP